MGRSARRTTRVPLGDRNCPHGPPPKRTPTNSALVAEVWDFAERPPRGNYVYKTFCLFGGIFAYSRYATLRATKSRRGKRLGRAQIPQRSEEEFCGTLGPTLGPLCASSPWPKRPPKRVPRTPQKGPPDPPKRTPQRVPQKTPKAKGEGCGGPDLGGFGARTAVYIYYGG